MSPVEDYLPEWGDVWEESEHKPAIFFRLLRDRGYIDQELYAHEIGMLVIPPEEIPLSPEALEILGEQAKASIWNDPAGWFGTAWREFLKAFWEWIKTNVTEFVDKLWGHIKATFEQYWPPIKDKLEAAFNQIYDWTDKLLLHIGEVTPERSTEMAYKMFGTAMVAGIAAHALSVGFEAIHPFKELGFGQMTGMVAQLGSFGPVSAATLGQIHYAALRRPMGYAMNARTRSQLPDDQLLQIMAVKPDITIEEFRHYMKYHGYSDFWIDRIEATMYHEPRYFELKMMSEDEAATDDWLFEKSRRAGFNEADSRIMVSSYVKAAARTQRQDYYKQAFNLYKEGYIEDSDFERVLAELEFRPMARKMAKKAASLAYLYDFMKDYEKYWTDSYLKDEIIDDELAVHLSLLGVVPQRVGLKVGLAKVRKYKKPAREESPELAKVMSQAQAKYSQAYIQLYRKERIDLAALEANLITLGIHPELAAATCALEEARATPALPTGG